MLTEYISLHFSEDGQYFLKVLIPSYAAGSIIGKGGQTIVQLQKETGATIKLSKSKDFYQVGAMVKRLFDELPTGRKDLHVLYAVLKEFLNNTGDFI